MGEGSGHILKNMAKIKKSLIITLFNEKATIESLIKSILAQSEKPDEVVIVDGGSHDGTVSSIRGIVSGVKTPKFKVYVKRGNRSIGRNEAIKRSTSEIIAITDAGCILDKNWFRNVTKPLLSSKIEVVAGYYRAKPKTIFEKCIVPYVFVMPNRIDPKTFLPATRSMAIRKSVWKKAGKFDEKLSNNEDYAFARKLKSRGVRIKFVKNAIVYWIPRTGFKQSFNMFYRFAKGDIEAGIIRPKVVFLFARYLIVLYLLFLYLQFVILLFIIYIFWSIYKNYRYVKDIRAVIFLPLIQFTADFAVISGTFTGFCKVFNKKWEIWAKKVNSKVKIGQHFNILAAALVISISLFAILTLSFPINFKVGSTTSINWYALHNYPKQMDYFYFEAGFVFVTFSTLLLWIIKIWTKTKK